MVIGIGSGLRSISSRSCIFGRGLQCWDIPRFFGGIREVGISQHLYIWDIPSVIKDGPWELGVWDIPNVTKDGLPGSAEERCFFVITVLQITTPPYGLIIDLSI